MSLLTSNSFEILSDPIVEIAENLTLPALEFLKELLEQKIDDPESIINDRQVTGRINRLWGEFEKEAIEWTDEALARAYLRGIKATNGQVPDDMEATEPIPQTAPILAIGAVAGAGNIATDAAIVLSDFPQHHTMYSVFQEQTYQQWIDTRIPVVRDVQDKVRRIVTETSDRVYRSADPFTRRELSQQLINRFADENITGIRYADGRTMKLDTYSEMVARSQTGNAAREAALRRQQEYGLDLVQITTHFPTSDLCAPWQGRVYSISGQSNQYPTLDTAIGGGLYHANCKHSQSAYIPGISKLPEKDIGKRRNREMYQAQQRQREIERKIRHYKRRKASAMTSDAEERAQQFISKWQGEQRTLIDNNSFLRRKFQREQI